MNSIKVKSVGASLEAPEYFTLCSVYPQRKNVQVKIYAVILDRFPGGYERRPYKFRC